jgi:Leucine Rich Repeat
MEANTSSGHNGSDDTPPDNEVVRSEAPAVRTGSPGVTLLRRSHSLSDLRTVSFSQQVGGNQSGHGPPDNRRMQHSPIQGKILPGSCEPSPDSTVTTHRLDKWQGLPPPPLENDCVQHPYTSPGAIRIRPLIQPPSHDFSFQSTARPNLDLEVSYRYPEILIEARLVEENTTESSPSSPPRPTIVFSSPTTPATMESHDGPPAMPVAPAKTVYFDNDRGWWGRRISNGQRLLLIVIVVLLGIIGVVVGFWLHGDSEEVPRVEADDAAAPNTTIIAPNETEDSTIEIFERDLPRYSRNYLADRRSPQARALAFLRQDPLLATYSKSRRLTRFALAVLYHSLHQDAGEWKIETNWLTNASECTWYSTSKNESTCNAAKGMNALALRENNLIGMLPAELELLAELQFVDLAKNVIRGSIPTQIGRMSLLRSLDLSDNDLNGTIPLTMAKLNQLTKLHLDRNSLSGPIPPILFGAIAADGILPDRPMDDDEERGALRGSNRGLRAWPALQVVDLGDNFLTGVIPFNIGMARNLQELNLRKNSFEGTIPESLAELTSLRYFGTWIRNMRCVWPSLSFVRSHDKCTG